MSIRNNIFSTWLKWHFIEMPKFLLDVWQNYILFVSHYFSLPILLKSLFAPWRKYIWNYPKGFDPKEFFSTLASNIISRLLGFFVRSILVILGIIAQICVIFIGAAVFLFWVLLPLIIILGFIFVFIYY